jgi:sugar phosphate permease
MVALGERFIYGTEIAGALIIGLALIGSAFGAEDDMRWKFIIGGVLCFCISLVFLVMYVNGSKERNKKKIE